HVAKEIIRRIDLCKKIANLDCLINHTPMIEEGEGEFYDPTQDIGIHIQGNVLEQFTVVNAVGFREDVIKTFRKVKLLS
ncbi:MAG: hypothetical protein HY786_07950, partial [Deltaproteobacteria bacterium]|nr:hypothetical protein [Deltaproteobacteria bacterium]